MLPNSNPSNSGFEVQSRKESQRYRDVDKHTANMSEEEMTSFMIEDEPAQNGHPNDHFEINASNNYGAAQPQTSAIRP